MRKRLYWVTTHISDDDGEGLAVVATKINEAREYGWDLSADSWIDIKAKWLKQYDVSEEPLGILDYKKGLKMGVYGWVDTYCSKCNHPFLAYLDNLFEDKYICENCKEELD